MIWNALLCFARFVDRVMGWAPTNDRWRPLDPGLSPAPIAAQRAQQLADRDAAMGTPAPGHPRLDLLTGDEATALAEGDVGRYGYTPPDPGTIDRSGLSIDPW